MSCVFALGLHPALCVLWQIVFTVVTKSVSTGWCTAVQSLLFYPSPVLLVC